MTAFIAQVSELTGLDMSHAAQKLSLYILRHIDEIF
jgi:hypothetical protein